MGNSNRSIVRMALTVLAVSVLGFLASCKGLPKQEPLGVPPSVEDKPAASSTSLQSVLEHSNASIQAVEQASAVIKTESAKARTSVKEVAKKVPEEQRLALDGASESLQRVDAKADSIVDEAGKLKSETGKLNQLVAKVDQLEDKMIKLESALEAGRAAALEKLYGYITMFWVIGFILLAAGAAVALFLNKGYGGSMALLGVMMLGFAAASHYYMEEIAKVGAVLVVVGFAGGAGLIARTILNSTRKETAVKEIVEMIEILKESMTDDEKARIFGPDGLASKVQSDLTKEIVAKIKERNGLRAKADLEQPKP
jgi:hypothetical protein